MIKARSIIMNRVSFTLQLDEKRSQITVDAHSTERALLLCTFFFFCFLLQDVGEVM